MPPSDGEPANMIARSRGRRSLDLPTSPPDLDATFAFNADPKSSSPPSPPEPAAPVVIDRQYLPGQPRSLAGVALRAFSLGAVLAASTTATALTLLLTDSPLWRLSFFTGALAAFHFLEFYTTARYNPPAATTDAFLLTANWPAYAIAHACGILEVLVSGLLLPGYAPWRLADRPTVIAAGLALVAVGQGVRTLAMVQCGESFNHIVQHTKKSTHALVTTGVYSTFRHPSYFGFFWWAVGTQLVLGNVVCSVAYTVVVWKFFSSRIPREEAHLVAFFGEEYERYRKRVGTWIPFIR